MFSYNVFQEVCESTKENAEKNKGNKQIYKSKTSNRDYK